MSGLGYVDKKEGRGKSKVEEEDEEEEDYMSDAFLAAAQTKDIRPGLKMSHARQREHEMLKRKERRMEEEMARKRARRNVHEMEADRRREGLEKRLDSSNKGFAMLQRMGYKAGEGLGKREEEGGAGKGRLEPIAVEVKADRGGLGREAVLKEVRERKAAAILRRMERMRGEGASISTQEFRAHHSRQRRLKLCQVDLHRSQKSCQQLDQDGGHSEPAESWFWPPPPPKPEDEEKEQAAEEEEVELEADEQLSILTAYLRQEYRYCLWCGSRYDDQESMAAECPGDTREAHDE